MEPNTQTEIPGTAVDAATPVSALELAGPLMAGMPEVTKPNGETPEVKNEPAKKQFPQDDKGNDFDPFLHKADENGNPVKNKNGVYYSKFIGRAGSKRKGESPPPSAAPPQKSSPIGAGIFEEAPKFVGVDEDTTKTVPPQESPKAETIDEATGTALLLVPTFDALMQSAFTAEIALTEEEMKRITPFAANYIRSKGMKDIPPGLALVLITVATYGPKFQKPTVKERFALYYLKVRNYFKK